MIEEYKRQRLNAKKLKRLRSKKVVFAALKKVIALSCVSGVVAISNLPLLDAYEAHIINVTAEIHKLDDPIFDPTSMSFCVMEEGVDVISTDPDDGPVVVHYKIGVDTLDPDLVLDPDCNSPAGVGDPSIAHIDIAQQDTVIKAVTCTADGLHKGRVVYEAYHFDLDLCPVICGDCEGKVSALTLEYNGSQAGLIRVVQKKDSGIVFENIVNPNEQFSFVGTVNGTLSTEITIYVDDVESVKIHTSCSEPIGLNMVFGDFTIIAGESSDGGPFCPVSDDVAIFNEFSILETSDSIDSISMSETPDKTEDLVDPPVKSAPEVEVDNSDSEVKNEDSPDTVDGNKDSADDDSDNIQKDGEIIAKDEEPVDTASEDGTEIEDDVDSNSLEDDNLDSKAKIEDLSDTADSDEDPIDDDDSDDIQEDGEVIAKDEESVDTASEDKAGDNNSDSDDNPDEVDSDGDGELPITPDDEETMVDFNLSL